MAVGGVGGVEPPFVGVSRRGLVDGLEILAARVAVEPVPCWVSLEAPSGWGKTRVARELYARLANRQAAPPYWPPSILAGVDGPLDDVSSRRKWLNPHVVHTPGSLPSFAWWGISCTTRHGMPSVALAQDIAVLESHAPYLEDAWLRLPRSSRLAADAREFLGAAADEAAMEVGGRALEAALGAAVPGLGLARWVTEWGWGKHRDRSDRSERLESRGVIAVDHQKIGDAVVEMVLRLARPGLPLILVVEDVHDADPLLIDVLDRIASGDASVLLVTTGWPGHLAESAALTEVMDRASERLVRISSESSGPPPEPFASTAGLGELERDGLRSVLGHYFPDVEPATAARLVGRYPNPLALELFCQIPLYRRRFATRELRLTASDVDALPETVRDLYRRLWEELPEPVRAALAIATLGIPAVIDPAAGRSQLWNTALMADALLHLDLPNEQVVSEALRDAPTAYAWARVVTDALRRFVEPDQLHVATQDRDQHLFADEVELINRAVVARLVPRLAGADERAVEEEEHDAQLLLALHAEGFVDDGDHVALAADVLVRLLRDDPGEVEERLRLARTGLRFCSPVSDIGLRLRTEEVRALIGFERVPEARPLVASLRRDVSATLGPTSTAAIELDSEAALMLRSLDPTEAHELATQTYKRAVEVLGADDRLTLQVANVLSTSLIDLGRLVEALELDRHILARREATLPPDDRETLLAAADLAWLLRWSGRLDEAEPLAVRTLEARTRVLGPMHADTLNSRRQLAQIHQQAGRPAVELELRREIVTDSRAALGTIHPSTLEAIDELRGALERAGYSNEALEAAEESVALARRSAGSDAPITWYAESELAGLLGRVGFTIRSFELHSEVGERVEATLGPDHPRTIRLVRNALYTMLAAAGASDVVPLAEELAGIARQALPPEHPDRLDTVEQLGIVYRSAGRNTDAEKVLEEVLVDRHRHQPFDIWSHALTLVQLAECWIAGGRTDEAQPRLERQLEACRGAIGESAQSTLELRLCLARVRYCDDPDAGRALVAELDRFTAVTFPVTHPLRIQLRANRFKFEDERDQGAGADIEFTLLTDLVAALGVAHPTTINQLCSFSNRQGSEHLPRVLDLCLDGIPTIREQAGSASPTHRRLLQAASHVASEIERDADVVDVRRELIRLLVRDPETDVRELCGARVLYSIALMSIDDARCAEVAREAVSEAVAVLAPDDTVLLSARRVLAVFTQHVDGHWAEALSQRIAVVEGTLATSTPAPDEVEKAYVELRETLAVADLPDDHPVRAAAVEALAGQG